MAKAVFDCQRCNQCCQGMGGIFLETDQLAPAAHEVDLTAARFAELYCRKEKERWSVLVDARGVCRLLAPWGCRIHAAKPEVCRRWPFMTAMLKDPGAYAEAKLACPGFEAKATHEDFLALALAQGYAIAQGE